MNRFIDRLKLFFVGVFAISCIAIWAYQLLWVAPYKRCEARGAWWDPATRVCATPIFLPQLTGRPLGAPPVTAKPAKPASVAAR
jgi:hypothetical protein